MFRLIILAALTLVATRAFAADAPNADPPTRLWRDAVDISIRKAQNYLYKTQPQWEPANTPLSERGAVTAKAVVGLCYSGESSQRRELSAAIRTLVELETTSTLARALRAELSIYAGGRPEAARLRELARKDAQAVLDALVIGPGGTVLHSAEAPDPSKEPKPLLTVSIGASVMTVNALAPFEVHPDYWTRFNKQWRTLQSPAGSFEALAKLAPDGGAPNPNASDIARVTAQALFVLQEASHQLETTPAKLSGNHLDAEINRAISFLGAALPDLLQGDRAYEAAYWATRSLTRAQVRFIGETDWAEKIVRFLVQTQKADGSWGNGPANTGYALMTLRFCRAPILAQKLRYTIRTGNTETEANWNQRPHDLSWMVQKAGGYYCEYDSTAFQIDLSATEKQLADVPILYLSGDQALTFNQAERAKLKQYIENGGLIVANADAASPAFADSFRQLGLALFPKYAFVPLAADHPLLSRPRLGAIGEKLGVEALSNGARDLMILLPNDTAQHWRSKSPTNTTAQSAITVGTNLIWKTWERGRRRENMFADSAPTEAPAQADALKEPD